MIRLLVLGLLWWCCALAPAAAADSDGLLVLDGASPRPEIFGHARYLVDRTGAISLDDLIAGRHAADWQAFPGRELAAGYVPGGAVWVRLPVRRADASAPAVWWLDAAWGFTDRVTLHVLHPDGRRETREGGRVRPFAEREAAWPGHAFRLALEDAAPREIYLRYASTGSLRIPLQVFADREFDDYRNRQGLVFGAFFGIMGLIGTVALLRALLRRSSLDATYGIYILAMETNNSVVSGWMQALGLVDDAVTLRVAGAVAIVMAALGLAMFLRDLITWPTDRLRRRLRQCFAVMALAYLAIFVITLVFAPAAITRVTNTVSGAIVILIAGLAIVAAWRRWPNARMFLAAFAPFMVAILARYGQSFGAFPGHLFTQYAIMLATLLHGIALLVVILVRDAESRARQQVMQWELDALQAGIDNQSTFLRMLAHEARTPLAVIDGQSQLLAANLSDPEAARQAISRIREAIRRVGDVLSRFMSQDRLMTNAPGRQVAVDLARLLADVVARSRRTTDHHLIQLGIDADAPVVTGDPALLDVLFQNLVDNAIRYSPEGGAIHVDLRAEGDRLVVAVGDEGIGIPPALQEKVFEPYFRVGEAEAVIGAGLGLVLVRKIARLHGGEVRLHSEPGNGSTFEVSLPRR